MQKSQKDPLHQKNIPIPIRIGFFKIEFHVKTPSVHKPVWNSRIYLPVSQIFWTCAQLFVKMARQQKAFTRTLTCVLNMMLLVNHKINWKVDGRNVIIAADSWSAFEIKLSCCFPPCESKTDISFCRALKRGYIYLEVKIKRCVQCDIFKKAQGNSVHL